MRDDESSDPFASLPELIERLLPAVRRLFYRQQMPAWDGEDLMQEALAAALRRWTTIDDKEGWLYGTVRRMCTVYWRERRRRRWVALDASVVDPRRTLVEGQERRDRLLDVDRECAKLPRHLRRLMYLRYGLGLGLAEIGSGMGPGQDPRVQAGAAGLGASARASGCWPPAAHTMRLSQTPAGTQRRDAVVSQREDCRTLEVTLLGFSERRRPWTPARFGALREIYRHMSIDDLVRPPWVERASIYPVSRRDVENRRGSNETCDIRLAYA